VEHAYLPYVDQAFGQFPKRSSSTIALCHCVELLNTVFRMTVWPPFTAIIEANRFQSCPIASSIYTFYVSPCLVYTLGQCRWKEF